MSEENLPQDGTPTPEPAPVAEPEPTLSEDKAAELIAQKRKANAEAVAAKKRAEAAEARLKEIEDKDKSALELAQAAAEDAKKRAEAAEARLSKVALTNKVMAQGATGPHADYVAYMFEQASAADDFDEGAFFSALREAQPYLFGGPAKPPAPASGAPGSPQSGAGGSKKAELEARKAALQAEIVTLRENQAPNRRRREDAI